MAERKSRRRFLAEGALALVIVLDQFSRNMFRGSARTFAADPLALAAAGRAIAHGYDKMLDVQKRTFLYLPYTHSENLADQAAAQLHLRAYREGVGLLGLLGRGLWRGLCLCRGLRCGFRPRRLSGRWRGRRGRLAGCR